MTTRTKHRNRLQRALGLLRAALGWSREHGRHARAARIAKAREDLTPPPIYPAVMAARRQSDLGPRFGEGECLMRVRECYGIAAREHDAAAAWRAAKVKHGPETKVPRGYPVFWTGGSHGFGHVAIATGDGRCWSTDIRRAGMFDLVPISEIHQAWGLRFVGWAEDLNGVHIKHGKAVTT